MNDTLLEKWLKDSDENARSFASEGLILDVTEAIYEALEESGLSKSDLAKSLGRSNPYVTQLLNGTRNMTLRTLSDIAYALGRIVTVRFRQRDEFGEWETVRNYRQIRAPKRLLADLAQGACNGEWSKPVLLKESA